MLIFGVIHILPITKHTKMKFHNRKNVLKMNQRFNKTSQEKWYSLMKKHVLLM